MSQGQFESPTLLSLGTVIHPWSDVNLVQQWMILSKLSTVPYQTDLLLAIATICPEENSTIPTLTPVLSTNRVQSCPSKPSSTTTYTLTHSLSRDYCPSLPSS